MMKLTLAAVLALAAGPVLAEGDSVAGGELFNKQCVACHVVQDAAGEILAGRNAKVGPNLFGVIGRQPGSYPDFKYGKSMIAYGETGVVWEEANFVEYITGPTPFLKKALDDKKATGKMAFMVKDEADRANVYAFLATFSAPAADPAAAPAEGAAEPAAPATN